MSGINQLHTHGLTGACGRWVFHEVDDVFATEDELKAKIPEVFGDMLSTLTTVLASSHEVR